MRPEGDITSALGGRKKVDLWGGEIAGEGLEQGEKWEGAPLPQQKQKTEKFPAMSGWSCDYTMLVRGSRIYRALEFYGIYEYPGSP